MKKISIVALALVMMLLLASCGSDGTNENEDPVDNPITDPDDNEDYIYLSLEELSEFDGKDGKDAYIAVDGKIYDVTESDLWPHGSHNGYQAGQDLTNEILNVSPHGLSTLDGVPLIGEIVE